jgi:dihydropteroate synthase
MFSFSGNGFDFPLGKKTYVAGILNITADSFFDGGRYNTYEAALKRAVEIEKEGADLLDIGAQSTRPGSVLKTADEEIAILEPVLKDIRNSVKIPVSVDTFYPSVARFALENGVNIINDVSGRFNDETARLVRDYNAGWIIMHTGGGDASTEVGYNGRVIENIIGFFDGMLEKCDSYGIKKNQIMLDVGIGFGKGEKDNLEVIKNLPQFKRPDVALMTALSCKRVIKSTSGACGEDLLYGTIAANTAAVFGKTDFIRVHHVRQNVLAMKTADSLFRS